MKLFTRYSFVILTVVVITFGCKTKTEGLKKSDINLITNTMLAMHVTQKDFNEEISKRTISNLVNGLDSSKMIFTKSDVAKFDAFNGTINEDVSSRDFSKIFAVFELFKKRSEERMKLLKVILNEKWDFTVDESINIDLDVIDYSDDEKEIKDRWRKRVKLQLLNLIQTNKSLEEAKDKVEKRYQLMNKEILAYTETEMLNIYMNSFATALDPHTNYLSPEEFDDFQIQMKLKLSGIGAVLRSEDGFVYVDSIIPGGPVSKMKEDKALKKGDKIIAVAQGNDEPEDVIDIPLRDAVQKIRGKKGSTVKLTVIRKNEKTTSESRLIIPVVRDEVILEQSAVKHDFYNMKQPKKEISIGYINFPSFYMDYNTFQLGNSNVKVSSKDIMKALQKFNEKNVDAVVLDMRGNPGGALGEAIKIAGYFIESGPVLQVKSRNDVDVYPDSDPEMQWAGPLVLLIDRSSASASEIVAGAIKDYKRGIILGPTSTFGKGTVQDMRALGNNSGAVKVTIQLFYQPSGLSNNKIGIAPDLIIPDITQLQDYNEGKMKYALDWQPLPKSDYQDFGTKFINPSIIKALKDKSAKRVSADKDFIELNKKITEYTSKGDLKTISLKKESFNDLSEEMTKKYEDKEKQRKGDIIIDVENDIFLREAFNITADYTEVLQK